jgi:hypothetical protein
MVTCSNQMTTEKLWTKSLPICLDDVASVILKPNNQES